MAKTIPLNKPLAGALFCGRARTDRTRPDNFGGRISGRVRRVHGNQQARIERGCACHSPWAGTARSCVDKACKTSYQAARLAARCSPARQRRHGGDGLSSHAAFANYRHSAKGRCIGERRAPNRAATRYHARRVTRRSRCAAVQGCSIRREFRREDHRSAALAAQYRPRAESAGR